MTIPILDIPNEPAEWSQWLERQLVGLHLRELVDELQVVGADRRSETASLDNVLSDAVNDVLTSGLSVLTHAQRLQLLRNPELLLQLQDRVLFDGGLYWDAIPITNELREAVASNWKGLKDGLHRDSSAGSTSAARADSPMPKHLAPQSIPTSRRTFFTLVGTLAASVAALLTWRSFQPTPWGFDRAIATAGSLSQSALFDHMATVLESDWNVDRTSTLERLRSALQQFSAACGRAVATDLPQLQAEKNEWFRQKCSAWRAAIDQHLADLEDDPQSFDDIRQQTNETVSKLINALRNQAKSVGA